MPINRFDNISIDELKMTETQEGYLEGFAIATRVGVFTYMKSDGTVQKEFRPPEEVFNEDSINSFKMIPITDEHRGLINAKNAKQVQVGITGQEFKKDDNYLAPFIKIFDKEIISQIKINGKRGLSFGYTVELEKADGIYDGEKYDYIQRNIRGNHLAIVNQGRAGLKARMRIDSEDAFCVNNNFNNNYMLKKIKIDSVEFEVAEEVAEKLDSSATIISALEAKNKELSLKTDSLQGENDGLKSQIENFKKQDNAKLIEDKIKSKMSLINKAKIILNCDEDLVNLSERQIHEKVISSIQPSAKFDGKSDEYVLARFDSIIEFNSNSKISEHFKIASKKEDSLENNDNSDISDIGLQNKLLNKKGE